MPYFRSLVIPIVRPSSLVSPQANLQILNSHYNKHCQTKKMNFTNKRLILFLVLILTTISMLRLLTTLTTYSSPSPSSSYILNALSPTFQASQTHLNLSETAPTRTYPNLSVLTEKEFQLLANLVASRAPCNILIFGLESEYLFLSSINHGGNTVFLEDDPDKILNTTETNSKGTRIYKVEYEIPAKEAYKLLKHARKSLACSNFSGHLSASKCRLALRHLPREVYELRWEVVVVDGPSGDSPEAPGRMAAIYTAAAMARSGNVTNVIVHDVDRMIERWFSWEFLCDENLVSSKGKLWNFRIKGQSNSTQFCPSTPVLLV